MINIQQELSDWNLNNPAEYRQALEDCLVTDEEVARLIARRAKKQVPKHLWPQCHMRGEKQWDLDPIASAKKMAAEATRIKGWLKASRSLQTPIGVGGLYKITKEVGEGLSPWHWGHPSIPQCSPGYIVSKWWRIYRRATEILKPYGWRVSRFVKEAIGRELLARPRAKTNKLAVIAAASSLPIKLTGLYNPVVDGETPGEPWWTEPRFTVSYKEAREGLIKAKGWKKLIKIWGNKPQVIKNALLLYQGGDRGRSLSECIRIVLQAEGLGYYDHKENLWIGGLLYNKCGIKTYACWTKKKGELRLTDTVCIVGGDYPPYYTEEWYKWGMKDAIDFWRHL